jgi:WD40 repeat protein
VSTGECLRTFYGHSDFVNSVSFSYDNKYVISGSNDGYIKMWKVSTGECLKTF